jgi:CheY-like chemotaxis protein
MLDCLPGEGYICINVTDTGKGIDLARIDDLFEPFNRMCETDAHTEGAGIGLAITKKLAELMKGCIEVESESGKGSCFTVKIPGGKVDAPVPEEKPELSPMTFPEVKTMRTVLYIEDNPDNLELVKSIFRRHSNMKLLSAVSAELGVEMAEVHQPDLILMDINLPGMLGDEAFLKLQKIEATKDIPVIALSANAMKRDIRSALDKGFTDYITKPIEVSNFMKIIQRVFDKP